MSTVIISTSRSPLISFCTLIAAKALCWAVTGVLVAASTDAPDAPLEVRPENAAALASAADINNKLQLELQEFSDALKANHIARIKPQRIGLAYARNELLGRLGGRLKAAGELAGTDFEYRSQYYQTTLDSVIDAYGSVPGFSAGLQRDRRKMEATVTRRKRELPAIGALAKAGNWQEAEVELLGIQSEILAMACWYSRETRVEMLTPFMTPVQKTEKEMAARREAAMVEAISSAWNAHQIELESFLRSVRTSAQALQTQPTTQFDDRQLAGPDLAASVIDRWRVLQISCVRRHALAWAIEAVASSASSTLPGESATESQAKLAGAMLEVLGEIVAADTQRVTGEEVSSLHQAYLPVFAVIEPLAEPSLIRESLEPRLHALAARSAEYLNRVQAYERATYDLLRWRQRVAARQAQALGRDLRTPYDAVLHQVSENSHLTELLPATSPRPARTGLRTMAPAAIAAMKPLVGTPVVVRYGTGYGDSSTALGRYDDQTYARTQVAETTAARTPDAIRLLEQDLWVTGWREGENLPLTLDAAAAVSTAHRGDFDAAGGQVEEVVLEPLVTRMATMPDLGWSVVPDRLPAAPKDTLPARQVVFRFKVNATWKQHRYFIIEAQP